jgi:hypothetical protein
MPVDETGDAEKELQPENPETVNQIAITIIDPALQKALGEARQLGTPQEALSALASCYGGLLVDILGRKGAAAFLQNHAIHVVSGEEKSLTN